MTKNIKEPIFRFRWKNFRSLKDTGWIDVKPLTIFIGSNNSGKTSLFNPLLIMKQTIESADLKLPLKTKGKYVKVINILSKVAAVLFIPLMVSSLLYFTKQINIITI